MAERLCVALISTDAALCGSLQRSQPPEIDIVVLSAEEGRKTGVGGGYSQVWIDLDTAGAVAAGIGGGAGITGAAGAGGMAGLAASTGRRVYFHSSQTEPKGPLPPGDFIRKPFSRSVVDVLWARVEARPAVATVCAATVDAAALPGWVLDFQELQLRELCRRMVADLPGRLGFGYSTLYLFDAEGRVLTLAETSQDRMVPLAIPLDDPREAVARAARVGKVQFSADGGGEDGGASRAAISGAVTLPMRPAVAEETPVLIAPLMSGGELRGVLVLNGGGAMAVDVAALEPVFRFLGRALEHAMAFSTTHIEARLDPLTRLYNRRWLCETLDREILRVERYQGVFSVLSVDLDGLKRVNDSVGHCAGDSALRHVANVLRESLRQVDAAARIGGDEFVVFLPGTSLDGAAEVAKRLRDAVRDNPPQFRGAAMAVTVSVGAAEWRAGQTTTDVIDAADRAMYATRTSGRGGANAGFASRDGSAATVQEPTDLTGPLPDGRGS